MLVWQEFKNKTLFLFDLYFCSYISIIFVVGIGGDVFHLFFIIPCIFMNLLVVMTIIVINTKSVITVQQSFVRL